MARSKACRNPPKRLLHCLIIGVRVNIKCNADIRVTHQVLQTFHINSGSLHIRTKRMPKDVGRYAGERIAVLFDPLLANTSHVVLQVHSYLGLSVLVQKQESATAVNKHLHLGKSTVCENVLERFADGGGHRNTPIAATRLGCCDEIGLVCRPAQLPLNVNIATLEVNVGFR